MSSCLWTGSDRNSNNPQSGANHSSSRSRTAWRLVALLHCLWLSAPVVGDAPPNAYAEPHFKAHRTGIVQLYEWKFADVAAECTEFLGPSGYAGVQLSPVTEHLAEGAWTARYQPVSYELATRSGDAAQFLQMSRACNAAGVRVYVEVVLNHMAAPRADAAAVLGTAGATANASALDYPAVPYSSRDFHAACAAPATAQSDAYAYRNCRLEGSPDLDHSRANVRQRIVTLLNKLVDLGVAGFRVAAAKCMWPHELQQIFDAVKNVSAQEFDFPADARPFFYMDVNDLRPNDISKTEYTGLGLATEYLYPAILADVLKGYQRLSNLINWGPAMGFLPHQHAVVFIDNLPEQRRSEQLLSHRQRSKYIMANAFMLAHPYGRVKLIMSSFYTTEDQAADVGAPVGADDGDAIASPSYDEQAQCIAASGWVCEHRWPAIANMIALVNSLSEEQDVVMNLQTDGADHMAFCRGRKAFIAFNNHYGLDYETELHTCLEAGTYCDVISGGLSADGADCRGRRVVVGADGVAKIMIPFVEDDDESGDASVVAIYEGSKLGVVQDGTEVTENNEEGVTKAVEDDAGEAEAGEQAVATEEPTVVEDVEAKEGAVEEGEPENADEAEAGAEAEAE